MEAYFIGVLMSAIPYLFGTLAVTALVTFLRKYLNLPHPIKVFIVLFLTSFFLAGIMPSNTYKHEAVKLPNPTVYKEPAEIEKTPPMIQQGKVERQERFDDLVDWKGRAK